MNQTMTVNFLFLKKVKYNSQFSCFINTFRRGYRYDTRTPVDDYHNQKLWSPPMFIYFANPSLFKASLANSTTAGSSIVPGKVYGKLSAIFLIGPLVEKISPLPNCSPVALGLE